MPRPLAVLVVVPLVTLGCRDRDRPRDDISEPGRAPAGTAELSQGEVPARMGKPHRMDFTEHDASQLVASRLYGTIPVGLKDPAPTSRQVLEAIRGWESWPAFPENASPILSRAHRRTWVVAHYNEAVGRAMNGGGALPLPEGSTIVKEQRVAPDSPAILLSVMNKRGGKWYWVQATTDGKVLVVGGEPFEGFDHYDCHGCHQSAADNDQVFTHDFAP